MSEPRKPAAVACCPDCKHLCEGCDFDAIKCPRMLRSILRKFSRWIHSADEIEPIVGDDFGKACDETVEEYLREVPSA